jgi:hypothetical protein
MSWHIHSTLLRDPSIAQFKQRNRARNNVDRASIMARFSQYCAIHPKIELLLYLSATARNLRDSAGEILAEADAQLCGRSDHLGKLWERARCQRGGSICDQLSGGREVTETEPGVYRRTEITDGYRVFELMSLLPGTGFTVHITKLRGQE